MKLYFIPLIDLLCIFNVKCLQGMSNSMSFSKDASIMGKTCPDNKAFTSHNIHSMFVCATMCHQDEMCASFFFSSSAGRCDGCKLFYNNSLALTEEMEGSMYYKRAVKHSYIGCMSCISYNIYEVTADMTVERCAEFCKPTMDTNPRFALYYGTHCLCGDYCDTHIFVSDDVCDMTCGGDPNQRCGGYHVGEYGYFSVYSYH